MFLHSLSLFFHFCIHFTFIQLNYTIFNLIRGVLNRLLIVIVVAGQNIVHFSATNPAECPYSFDQADSTLFAVSASAPAAVATAAAAGIIFTLKADWKWLAVAGSLSIQVWMQGKNLLFSHWGCEQ